MNTQVNLSPPWYTLWNMVNSIVGKDPAVTVGQLQTSSMPYVIPISLSDQNKAQALANILIPTVQLGNITVNLQVSVNGKPLTPVSPKNPEDLANMVQVALKDNTLFVEVLVQPIFPYGPAIVWPVFTKSVVQFYNDDLSDLYHNFNGVTADVCKQVLNTSPGGFYLYASTIKQD